MDKWWYITILICATLFTGGQITSNYLETEKAKALAAVEAEKAKALATVEAEKVKTEQEGKTGRVYEVFDAAQRLPFLKD